MIAVTAEMSAAAATAGCGTGAPFSVNKGCCTPAPPVPEGELTLAELIPAIDVQMRHCVETALSKRWECRRLLEQYKPTAEELQPFLHFDTSKAYCRNLIFANDIFTLMLLCWTPSCGSPIHDHPSNGCWVRVYQGVLKETRYSIDTLTNRLIRGEEMCAKKDDVLYIDDSMGLHKVENPSGDEMAVSLHLYSPPYSQCRVWLCENQADKPLKPTVTYHSAYGEITCHDFLKRREACSGNASTASGTTAKALAEITTDEDAGGSDDSPLSSPAAQE